LRACVRETDTVARFGGDEFVVVLSDLGADRTASAALAGAVAEKIRIALAAPYRLTVHDEGQAETIVEHHCSASIGLALFIGDQAGQDEILKWADAAMYQAKDAGHNLVRMSAQPAQA
jgi:diguanylate cyclase (GGDEF)-like protein